MKKITFIFIGIIVYILILYSEKAIHYLYFYWSHDFATNNILLIKSSLLIQFAPIVGGFIVGYFTLKGFYTGFLVGLIAALIVLLIQTLTGANPFNQEFTPSILFDEVIIKACIAALAGAAGELVQRKKINL